MLDKKVIKNLLERGYTYNEIALKLDSNVATVKKCIYRNFKDLLEKVNNKKNNKKEEIKELYKKGFTSKEIGRKLLMNSSTIRNLVITFDKQAKMLHENKLKERKNIRKEMTRILNKENNNYMSTEQLVKQNIQSYEVVNGKLRFNISKLQN